MIRCRVVGTMYKFSAVGLQDVYATVGKFNRMQGSLATRFLAKAEEMRQSNMPGLAKVYVQYAIRATYSRYHKRNPPR